jgi:5-methylcytosine-specific restriction protein A
VSRSLTSTQRLALFLAANGQCQACVWPLTPGTRWEVDHIIPVALGGSRRPDNLQVLCAACHGSKTTRRDAPAIAKAKRVRARHLGATRPRSILPGSRRSPWRKRIDGRVERRAVK